MKTVIIFVAVTLAAAGAIEVLRLTSENPRPVVATAPTESAPKEPDAVKIKMGVGFTGSNFGIINLSGHDLIDVDITLNPGFMAGGYGVRVPRLKNGGHVELESAQFRKRNGVRYDPGKEEPSFVNIRATDAKGVQYLALESVRAL